MAGELLAAHPETLLHTHLSENAAEIAAVAEAFLDALDYLDAYDRFGLVGPRSVAAHGVRLDHRSCSRLVEAGRRWRSARPPTCSSARACSAWPRRRNTRLRLGLGTDIGARTSFSLLSTAGDLYKVGRLSGTSLDPLHCCLSWRPSAARGALHLDRRVGSFAAGRGAEFRGARPGRHAASRPPHGQGDQPRRPAVRPVHPGR